MSQCRDCLLELKKARDDELLDAAEFASEKALLLSGDEKALSRWQPAEGGVALSLTELQAIKASLSELLASHRQPQADDRSTTRVRPINEATDAASAPPSAKRYRTASERAGSMASVLVEPSPRPDDQPSIFSVGVTCSQTKQDGRRYWYQEARSAPQALLCRCPVQGCGRAFKRPCDLAKHSKTHSRGSICKPITSMISMQNEMSEAQRRAARDVEISFIISGILGSVVAQARAIGGWKPKDGRCGNHGTYGPRRPRSPAYKAKVIKTYERYCEQYPERKDQMAYLVGLQLGCNDEQVRKWYRGRGEILEAARGKQKNCRYLASRKRGRFHRQEQAVYNLFVKERAESRRVGPRWLKSVMKIEVAKLDSPEARLFTASQGWLWRFTRRWKIALRRKSNVKKVPISEREPLLQRYFAVLRAFKIKRSKQLKSNDGVWGCYPNSNHWSLDQVPAGLFDPKSTYDVKGVDRVVIAANESADNHRFMTLQVLLRNINNPQLPRNGQPKLCVIFRGKGQGWQLRRLGAGTQMF